MRALRPHFWWMIPTLGVAAGLGWSVGYPLAWLGYAAFNISGVWLYYDGARSRRRRNWMKVLAILMVPVGVIGVLASDGSGMRPTEAVTFGSDDESTRTDSVRAFGLFNRGSV